MRAGAGGKPRPQETHPMQRLRFLPALLAVFLLTGCGSKPYDDAVTLTAAANAEEILAAISSQLGNETVTGCCAVPGSRELADALDLNAWTVTDTKPSGDAAVTLRFAEGWLLSLYPNGRAAACNTYAAPDTQGQCFYQIPEDISTAVSDFLSENGVPHTLGDGSIGAGTFSHS